MLQLAMPALESNSKMIPLNVFLRWKFEIEFRFQSLSDGNSRVSLTFECTISIEPTKYWKQWLLSRFAFLFD